MYNRAKILVLAAAVIGMASVTGVTLYRDDQQDQQTKALESFALQAVGRQLCEPAQLTGQRVPYRLSLLGHEWRKGTITVTRSAYLNDPRAADNQITFLVGKTDHNEDVQAVREHRIICPPHSLQP